MRERDKIKAVPKEEALFVLAGIAKWFAKSLGYRYEGEHILPEDAPSGVVKSYAWSDPNDRFSYISVYEHKAELRMHLFRNDASTAMCLDLAADGMVTYRSTYIKGEQAFRWARIMFAEYRKRVERIVSNRRVEDGDDEED